MPDPISPTAQHREPKTRHGTTPAALSRWGIQNATENCNQSQSIRAGDLIWRYYGDDLNRKFL